MQCKQELLFSIFLVTFANGEYTRKYAVDIGKNLTLPCPIENSGNVKWILENRQHRPTILTNGSLFISKADKNDSGIYICSLENTVSDDLQAKMNVTVRTPPPKLANVLVHPSTILALLLWEVHNDGGYPIMNFTAQYRLHDEDEWRNISPNHISPNSRQIEIYKLEPNASYDFRIWGTNQLGKGEIVEVSGTTLKPYTEQEQARRLLAGAEHFDTRIWVAAVAIVMGTLIILGLGTCFLLYQECRTPGGLEEQEIIELVPNIILNPGFEGSSRTQPSDENANSETTTRLNNNTVVVFRDRHM